MSKLEYDKLRELAAKAAPLPWHAPGMGEVHTADHLLIFDLVCDPEGTAEDDQMACGTDADCEYAVAACNAVPGLLDENERLRKALERTQSSTKRMLESRGEDLTAGIILIAKWVGEALERK